MAPVVVPGKLVWQPHAQRATTDAVVQLAERPGVHLKLLLTLIMKSGEWLTTYREVGEELEVESQSGEARRLKVRRAVEFLERMGTVSRHTEPRGLRLTYERGPFGALPPVEGIGFVLPDTFWLAGWIQRLDGCQIALFLRLMYISQRQNLVPAVRTAPLRPDESRPIGPRVARFVAVDSVGLLGLSLPRVENAWKQLEGFGLVRRLSSSQHQWAQLMDPDLEWLTPARKHPLLTKQGSRRRELAPFQG